MGIKNTRKSEENSISKEPSLFAKIKGALLLSGKSFSASYNSSKLWQGYLIALISIFLLSFVLSTSTFPLFMDFFPHIIFSFSILGVTIWVTFSPLFFVLSMCLLCGFWWLICFAASYLKKLKVKRTASALGFALTPIFLLIFYLLNKFILQSFKYELGPLLIGIGVVWTLMSGVVGLTSLLGVELGGLLNYSFKSIIFRKKRTYGAVIGITVAIGLIVTPIPIVSGYYSQLNNLAGAQQYSQYLIALESGKTSLYNSFIPDSVSNSLNHSNIEVICPETYLDVNISLDEMNYNLNLRGINYSIFKSFRTGFNFQIIPTETLSDEKIIIGSLLASILNVTYADLPLNVSLAHNLQQYNVTIIGFLTSEIQYDLELLATINLTRSLKPSLSTKYSLIELKLEKPSLVDATIQALRTANPDLGIERENQLTDFVSGIISRTIQSIWLLSLVVYVAMGFGMFHVMQTTIKESEQEIAILKSVGASKFQIVRIFLYQSIILCLIGAALGVLSGIFLSYGASFIVSQMTSIVARPSFDALAILLAISLGLVTGILGSLYPAYKASKKTVGEIMK